MTDLWKRIGSEPFISPRPQTLAAFAVTTPDVLAWRGQLYLYVGAVGEQHERILTARLQPEWLHRPAPASLLVQASIAVDIGTQAFERLHVFDPAAVVAGDRVYLYYSALGGEPESLGLATSADGIAFEKRAAPVLRGRSPEVVHFQGQFHLFYVLPAPGKGYAVHLALSPDGERFAPFDERPVFAPGLPGAWDDYEVTTPRIFAHRDVFYMLYASGSSAERPDKPVAFGLARSTDLKHWERYPRNPVFHVGARGAWDDGALWFGTVFAAAGRLYLMYEGGCAGDVEQQGIARTQVGLAAVDAATFEQRMLEW